MLRPAEQQKLDNIKKMVHNSVPITAEEKQWVIDIHVRERKPVSRLAAMAAQVQGFHVGGLLVA